MYNEHYRVTHKSWFHRLIESYFGMGLGFFLILIATALLWYNESRAVEEAEKLEFTKNTAIHIESNSALDKNNGKLVHLNGEAISNQLMEDFEFGISINALRLKRIVEMYQWKENRQTIKEENPDGSQTSITRYSYHEVWSQSLISSYSFDDRSYYNPESFPIESFTESSSEVFLDSFRLHNVFVKKLDQWQPISIPESAISNGLQLYPDGSSNIAFIGRGTLQRPAIGDIRVYFEAIPQSTVSVMGQQTDGSIIPFKKDDSQIAYLNYGTLDIAQMIEQGHEDNASITWSLRLAGVIIMIIAVFLIIKPLVIMGKPIPLIGQLVEMGALLISLIVGSVLSSSVIGTSWLIYNLF